jgi:hypothetical protein
MPIFRGEDVANNLPGDAGLVGLRWSPSRLDLVIELALPDGAAARLSCTWARELAIQLDYDVYAGPFPAWEHSITRSEGGYTVEFDFQPVGSLRLKCAEVSLDVGSTAKPGSG